MHGGTIAVASKPGAGTTFTLTIPDSDTAEAQALPAGVAAHG
jgi:signal transduction histidine kinase